MDFSAWMEVSSGGAGARWTRGTTNRGSVRVMMAISRDATDVAIITHFGPATLNGPGTLDELPG